MDKNSSTESSKKKGLGVSVIGGLLVLIVAVVVGIALYQQSQVIEYEPVPYPCRPSDPYCATVDKPMIYLYPTTDSEVEVKLGNPEKITTSYPKYDGSWRVFAKKDGSLEDLKTGRKLYGLYWEGVNYPAKQTEEGFIVKGSDSAAFLEEKLVLLGLNERESEEFIVYWLPKMEANKYNYVRFDTNEILDEYMPLYVSPKPDTVIRIAMTFRALDNPIEIREQELTTPIRDGFVVVEWGGSELK